MRQLGQAIYDRYTRDTDWVQCHYTCFMRNPPLLRALADSLVDRKAGDTIRLASIGCSTGAELYSALAVIRTKRPDLNMRAEGADLVDAAVDAARAGLYSTTTAGAHNSPFRSEIPELLPQDVASLSHILENVTDGKLHVRDWLRAGVTWRVADATDPDLPRRMGRFDIVMANNFLGAMPDDQAEKCIRNVVRLVEPNGVLTLDGVDLDLKARVTQDLGLDPVFKNIEAIYTADVSKHGWPFVRWAHEPMDRTRTDWIYRYAILYRKSD